MGRFLLDGAHNVAAATALAAFLEEFHPERVWIIFGAMADKPFEEMIGILKPYARQFIFCKPTVSEARSPFRACRACSFVEVNGVCFKIDDRM